MSEKKSARVKVRLTAALFHGKKKISSEHATVFMTDDSVVCIKSAIRAFAKALSAEN